ncbi:hypothetical protein CcCBS67573_g10344, partial [Chytriomyces confervae]
PFLKKKTDGLDSSEHQNRLEAFYEGQADIYDETRRRLLRGRSTMLKLCAAQLAQFYPVRFANDFKTGKAGESVTDPSVLPSPPISPSLLASNDKRYAWIDIGGGTGANIEMMNTFFPIRNFDKVYLVDITPSLCKIAEERFKRLGWTNVSVICMDASKFTIPKEDGEDLEIALMTMSYSLSMIEAFYPIVDGLVNVLSPTGIFGVVDFYVSSKRSSDPTRQLSWLSRWFWSIWFDADNIYLHPCRRDYLEHKFKTVKTLNGKNRGMFPGTAIPYYIWIGAQHGAELESIDEKIDENDSIAEEEEVARNAALATVPKLPHVSSDHVHGQGLRWRQPFDPALIPRFSTYIYAFAWEDPRTDLEFLDLTPDDRMMIITSGGCNALEYACKVGPARIHCVDLNPCQNNMLELKLAGISSLQYADFWRLFGEGYIPNFSNVLDTHFSPYLSPYAYHFWKETAGFKNLFKTGCSGLAIRIFQFVAKARGLAGAVERMCNADTIEEQWNVWEKEIRPHFLSKWLIMLLNNDRFLWGALGVPPAQMQMLLEEGSAYDYVVNTFDPIIKQSHLRDDNYFYYVCLMLKYTPQNAPSYLTEEGFNALQQNPSRLDAFRIHTRTIVEVLKDEVADGELTRVILMDHLDWFSQEDADEEITAVARKTAKGGRAYWRSAGKYPWYNSLFEERGFKVSPCQIRDENQRYIDRVNTAAFVYKSRTASSVQRAPTLSDTRPFTGATYHPSTFSLDKIPSLSGKTALVTGGNTGIGYHTCKHLALNGAKVLMACRDKERANNAIARIQNEAVAAGKTVDIEFVHLDLADLAQVKQAAVGVSQRIAKLDILVNNAGIMDVLSDKPFKLTKDLFESMFAVNHLGHFMLTKHLMPSILMSSNPRVVILSSYAQWRAPLCGIDFSSLTNFNESYAGTHYYGQSKLANLLFSNELAARYPHKLLVNA